MTKRYTRDEAAVELGIAPEQMARLWNAFGFARHSETERLFTDDDLAALRLLAGSVGAIPDDQQVATARAIGQTMARLADWQADMLVELTGAGVGELPDLVESIATIQADVWRRHLQLALARGSVTDDEAAESQRLAGVRTTEVVGFADIVGFTSLSRRIDMGELEMLLEAFEARAHEVITAHGGRVVKTLGDAVLFTHTDPGQAAVTALELLERVAGVEPVPPLRVGMAHGEVLSRHGDVFGEPVNIASRLCGSARPDTILLDADLAALLEPDRDRFRVRPIPTMSVRGYRRLRASTLTRPKA